MRRIKHNGKEWDNRTMKSRITERDDTEKEKGEQQKNGIEKSRLPE
jgi:hypothetical protein